MAKTIKDLKAGNKVILYDKFIRRNDEIAGRTVKVFSVDANKVSVVESDYSHGISNDVRDIRLITFKKVDKDIVSNGSYTIVIPNSESHSKRIKEAYMDCYLRKFGAIQIENKTYFPTYEQAKKIAEILGAETKEDKMMREVLG